MVTGDFMITAAAIAKQVFNCIFPLQTVLLIINLSSRSESSHRIGMIPFIAFLGQRALALATSQEKSEKKTKETSFFVSVREAAAIIPTDEMKPTDDDPIKAIVLTGDDVEQLTVDNSH